MPILPGCLDCCGIGLGLFEELAMLARDYVPHLAAGFTPKFVMGGTLGTSNGFPMIIERRALRSLVS